MESTLYCPNYSSFFGFAGVFSAVKYFIQHDRKKQKKVNRLFFSSFAMHNWNHNNRWHSAVCILLKRCVERKYINSSSTFGLFFFFYIFDFLKIPFFFLALGAAYGTSKAGIGIAGIGSFKPELVMKVSAQYREDIIISKH
jgi:hypothetical protein